AARPIPLVPPVTSAVAVLAMGSASLAVSVHVHLIPISSRRQGGRGAASGRVRSRPQPLAAPDGSDVVGKCGTRPRRSGRAAGRCPEKRPRTITYGNRRWRRL